MSNNIELILVGTGYMGKEYIKVLDSVGVQTTVVCRRQESADNFEEETGHKAIYGGISALIDNKVVISTKAIVAVNVENLKETVIELLNLGVKKILVEKPAGLNKNEICEICEAEKKYNAEVFVAYNRRFYASTEKALEIIKKDGGVESFNFEFTEWADDIKGLKFPDIVKENWLLANSSHVIDLAFFLGGEPKEMVSYSQGKMDWHERASKYSGAGVTNEGVTFSYCANWDAPGRWSVEVLTRQHRLYFKPMEKLFVQKRNSVALEEEAIEDAIDKDYKPGLYKQVCAFLDEKVDSRLLSIDEQYKHMLIYDKIEGLE